MTNFQPVRGTRDFLPKEMRKRNFVFDTVRSVFESYGFEAISTPAIESLDLLIAKGSGGEEIKKEIYAFKDKGDRDIGLRFDLTVPTARVIACNPELPKPIKRYCIDKVWRYDRPQAGRYREFTQADVDIFGCGKVDADFEICLVTIEVFKRLGFKDFKIRFNNKKVLEALVLAVGIPEEKAIDVFRAIDKLDKIGWQGVRKELIQRKVPNYEKVIKLIQDNDIKKDLLKYDVGKAGKEEVDLLVSMAKDAKLEKYFAFDLSLVRGLEYYTGLVFEVSAGGKWSVGGGGRYDKLIELYGGRPTPAVGISYGIERIIQIMDSEKMFPDLRVKEVYVAPVFPTLREQALEIAAKLRLKGFNVEVDLMERKLRKQLEFASSRGIPKVIIVGKKELDEGKVVVRDMETGAEKKASLKDLANHL